MTTTGLCRTCDWKGSSERISARGPLVDCEWFSTSKYSEEIRSCDGFTSKSRFPHEARAQYEVRKHSEGLEVEKHSLAQRADKRAMWAILIALLSLLISVAKFFLDLSPKIP